MPDNTPALCRIVFSIDYKANHVKDGFNCWEPSSSASRSHLIMCNCTCIELRI